MRLRAALYFLFLLVCAVLTVHYGNRGRNGRRPISWHDWKGYHERLELVGPPSSGTYKVWYFFKDDPDKTPFYLCSQVGDSKIIYRPCSADDEKNQPTELH